MNGAARGRGRGPVRIMVSALAVAIGSCAEAADPADVISARTLGLAYLEESRLEEAEAEFRRVIRLAPHEPLGYANLGLVYLRRARHDDAERAVRDALQRSDGDPDIRLILATVYQHAGRLDEMRRVLDETLQVYPDHVKSLYTLGEWYREADSADAAVRRGELLGRVVLLVPANLPARLQLIDLLLRAGDADSARAHLEQVRQQVPEIPPEAEAPFLSALTHLQTGNAQDAIAPFSAAHNALRVTQIYSAGILDVMGPGGPLVGFPVLTFSRDFTSRDAGSDAVRAAMRFVDATGPAGLGTQADGGRSGAPAVAVGDFDGDRDMDLAVSSDAGVMLLRNELGEFQPAGTVPGGPLAAGPATLMFADVDNNGTLDLFAASGTGHRLLYGDGAGAFRDATRAAALGVHGVAAASIAFDFDQDGDIDVALTTDGEARAWQNNLDGSFLERGNPAGLAQGAAGGRTPVLGDFDGDGDIDLALGGNRGVAVLSNARQGRFVTTIVDGRPSRAVAAGDVDNDGWEDVVAARGGEITLYRNASDTLLGGSRSVVGGVTVSDIADLDLLDLDNDGRLDLVVGGAVGERGAVQLLFGDGQGTFVPYSAPAPELEAPVQSVTPFDYNEDGDLDLLVAHAAGLALLRNDGGNANHYFSIGLVGLSTGSGKNNHFGIGARVEVRAGDLYQVRTVTTPVTHFGLGEHVKVDAVRIQWTNGVPQNLFYPGTDQDVVEEQTLKGSCAFLYTWDGERYTFVTDVLWRSALGMPAGILGGAGGDRSYASAYASQEYVRIPGHALRPTEGLYTLQLTEELWEAAYVDEVRLVVLDHPESLDVFVDERFVPPGPDTRLNIYRAGTRFSPARATDARGTDLGDRLAAADFVYVDNLVAGAFQGLMETHDLLLELGPGAEGRDDIILYLQGWVFPADASINVAVAQSRDVAMEFPVLQVRGPSGEWVTADAQLSFPSGKNKTVIADLTGKFPTRDRSVRIRTNVQIYWDYVFFTTGQPDVEIRSQVLTPAGADLHYRGFSRMYRRGGRYGPHWFDYQAVTSEDPWGPVMAGAYTRYGDVRELLAASDDRYVVMMAGDEMTVQFDATGVPPPPPGWTRDFLIYTDGWIKDADLNTATGNTVGPLPFHAMREYPYAAHDAYPADSAHRDYLATYQTRKVTIR